MSANFEHNGDDEPSAARLTAYALGQTEGAERAESEAHLAASPQLREQVEQIRALGEKVRTAFRSEPAAEPSPKLVEAVERKLAEVELGNKPSPAIKSKTWSRTLRARIGVFAAICAFALALPAYLYFADRDGSPKSTNIASTLPTASYLRDDSGYLPAQASQLKSGGNRSRQSGIGMEPSIRMGTQENQINPLPPGVAQNPEEDNDDITNFSHKGGGAAGGQQTTTTNTPRSDLDEALVLSDVTEYPAGGKRGPDEINGDVDKNQPLPSVICPSRRRAVSNDPARPDGDGSGSGCGDKNVGIYGGAADNGWVYSVIPGKRVEDSNVFSTDPKAKPSQSITTWQPARIVANTSRLMVGEKDELPLKGMQVDVRIDGFRARVVLDLYYFNDRPQQLEGNFQLRLPDEASPYFFAFGRTVYQAAQATPLTPQDSMFFKREQVSLGDTTPDKILELRSHSWEQPKVARMVPKEKAALAYRETVRRRVDPALVEWAGAGVFQCRVFPLAANSLHRIVIGYDVDLLPVGDDLELRLDLPSHAPACVVDVNVAAEHPKDVSLDAVATPSADGERLSYRLVDPKQRPLAVRMHKPGAVMLAGGDDAAGRYFATRIAPTLPKTADNEGAWNAVFLVDTSASAGPQFPLWTKLLKATLDNNRDSIGRFAVLFFNVETSWWQEKYVANTPKNVDALMEVLSGRVLEGATDLGRALQAAAHPAWMKESNGESRSPDLFLLSDGASTWGEDRWPLLARSLGASPLYAYRTGLAGTDLRMLSLLAEKTGGAVFSVVGEAEIAQASVAHRARPWKITGVDVQGGRDVLLAGRPQYLFPGQQLTVVGRLDRDDAAIHARHVGSAKDVTLTLQQGKVTQKLTIPVDRMIDSELAARAYGQVATGQLEDLAEANEPLATAYARHFRVTGRTCSLLMLDSDADYARYNIKPEEDSFAVKEQPAAAVVAKVAAENESLGDAKTLFMRWYHRLNESGQVHFDLPASLGIALDNLPAESFEIAGPALQCKLRQQDDLPPQFRQPWRTGQPDYEAFAAEAERRRAAGDTDDAVRAISTLVEERPGDVAVARDVAFSTIAWGRPAEAYHLLRRAAAARAFEPVTFHALAHCMELLGNADMAIVYYELLCAGQWDGRFGDVHNIAQLDYLRFLRRLSRSGGNNNSKLANYAAARLETLSAMRLQDNVDVAAMILWNTDGTDVDLHVIEPSGEECFYQHTQTASGGHISRDVTTGYGPELYLLPHAPAGAYKISAHYYAADANRTSTRTRVLAFLYQGWGTENENVAVKAVALVGRSESHELGLMKVK